MRGIVVFSGSSNPVLCEQICQRLGCEPGKSFLNKFSNNETRVELYESVREQDVYIIQSGCGHVNDNFMELLIMIQACKTASARKVTAVIPYFPYSRQPDVPYKRSGAPLTRAPPPTVPPTPQTIPSTPTHQPNAYFNQQEEEKQERADDFESLHFNPRLRGPTSPDVPDSFGCLNFDGTYRKWVARSGKLVADLLSSAGADHIITMDLHDPQFQGFFDCPVDNLSCSPIMIKYIQHNIPNYHDAVLVSPDAGGAKRTTAIAEKLHMDFALIHKERVRPGNPQKHDLMLVGDVRGRPCILVDDIADTSYTIAKAAKMLHENGATQIYALVTHALLTGDAMERISSSYLDKVIVSDSVPQREHVQRCSKITTYSIAPVFAEAIRRIHNGESVSMLFDPEYELF